MNDYDALLTSARSLHDAPRIWSEQAYPERAYYKQHDNSGRFVCAGSTLLRAS
jgi:hypothetical protein